MGDRLDDLLIDLEKELPRENQWRDALAQWPSKVFSLRISLTSVEINKAIPLLVDEGMVQISNDGIAVLTEKGKMLKKEMEELK